MLRTKKCAIGHEIFTCKVGLVGNPLVDALGSPKQVIITLHKLYTCKKFEDKMSLNNVSL